MAKLALLLFCFIASPAFAAAPTLGAISPSSGSTAPNIAKTFTATYSDTDGWADLKEAYFLISTSATSLANSVYVLYDQNTNLLYLRDDANASWLGGFAPGSANIIENSQAKLNCSLSSVSSSSSNLTLKLNLIFKSVFSGKTYNTYLKATDDTNNSVGFTKKGAYTVTYKPTSDSIIPSSGASSPWQYITFTTAFSDLDGWQNIQYVYFLVSASSSTRTSCLYAYYNQNTNRLYLRNDADSAWLGGFNPGSANIIENSYAKLDCSKTSTSSSSSTSTLIVNWLVSFKNSFTGTKNTYLYVRDDANASSGWINKGMWSIILDMTPPDIVITEPKDGQVITDP